jgi:hypothetical protein
MAGVVLFGPLIVVALVTEHQSPLRNPAVDNPFSLGNDFVSATLFEIGGTVR